MSCLNGTGIQQAKNMKQILRYTGYVLVLVIAGFLLWKFYYIFGWILVAAVLSNIGAPLVLLFDRIHIKKYNIPHGISTALTLLILVLFFLGILSLFVPLFVKEAQAISKIDLSKVSENIQGPLKWVDDNMHHFGAIPEDQTLQDFISSKIAKIVNFNNLRNILGVVVNTAGNLFLGFFAILFITFFFLKDRKMFENVLLLFTPEKHQVKTRAVLTDSHKLLKRYLFGISMEVLGVISLVSFTLWLLGVENALLIGFFGGIMNVIPYIGPVIGSFTGISLGIISSVISGSSDDITTVFIKLACVFFAVNFTDGHILQPIIYSKSIKSHPLEVFIVIIMGEGLAGLPGILLAVPVYTILRVIAKEFFQEFRVVKKITETMDK